MDLPIEIFEIILNYLSVEDIFNLSETSKHINCLCKSSKTNKTVRVSKDQYNIIKNKWPKLKYFVDYPMTNIIDPKEFSNVYKLNLSNSQNLKDVSKLKNLHTLYLKRCKNVLDVSSLKNLHTLDISLTNISDVSSLKNLHTLDISHCHNITNISCLGNLYEINISYTGIDNIDCLKNVKKINASGCYNLLSINEELNCDTIDLSHTRIIYVHNLKNVKNICLSYSKVFDVKSLVNAEKLIMIGCPNVINFYKLVGKVKYLDWIP
tara:strand:+ start:904 stop:1698 length:795 start_codon:yes stop_codon:yes gene_type:complete